jgi:hypothetical protein
MIRPPGKLRNLQSSMLTGLHSPIGEILIQCLGITRFTCERHVCIRPKHHQRAQTCLHRKSLGQDHDQLPLGRPELDSVGQRRRRGNAERAGQGEGRIGNRDRRGACEKLGQRYSRGQRGTGDFRYAIS